MKKNFKVIVLFLFPAIFAALIANILYLTNEEAHLLCQYCNYIPMFCAVAFFVGFLPAFIVVANALFPAPTATQTAAQAVTPAPQITEAAGSIYYLPEYACRVRVKSFKPSYQFTN